MTITPLTPEEKAELDALNQAVTDALAARTAWLDAAMVAHSSLKVGDDIYEVTTGRRLGRVSKLYRYHAHHSPLYDTSHYCDYEYEMAGMGMQNCYGNTSSQVGLQIGTLAEAQEYADGRAKLLRIRAS